MEDWAHFGIRDRYCFMGAHLLLLIITPRKSPKAHPHLTRCCFFVVEWNKGGGAFVGVNRLLHDPMKTRVTHNGNRQPNLSLSIPSRYHVALFSLEAPHMVLLVM